MIEVVCLKSFTKFFDEKSYKPHLKEEIKKFEKVLKGGNYPGDVIVIKSVKDYIEGEDCQSINSYFEKVDRTQYSNGGQVPLTSHSSDTGK